MKTTVSIFILAATVAFSTGCKKEKWPCKRGKGSVQTETRATDLVTDIKVELAADVFITQNPSAKETTVEIEAQPNLMDVLKTDVEGAEMTIYFSRCVRSHDPIKIYITTAQPEGIELDGSGNITGMNEFNVGSLDVDIDGSGDITLAAVTTDTDLDITGSGSITMTGSTTTQDILISGSGDIDAFGFESDNTTVKISGSGNCEVFVNTHLDANISGSGNVYYKGAGTVSTNITGSGDVVHQN